MLTEMLRVGPTLFEGHWRYHQPPMTSGGATIHAHGCGIRTVIDARVFYYQATVTRKIDSFKVVMIESQGTRSKRKNLGAEKNYQSTVLRFTLTCNLGTRSVTMVRRSRGGCVLFDYFRDVNNILFSHVVEFKLKFPTSHHSRRDAELQNEEHHPLCTDKISTRYRRTSVLCTKMTYYVRLAPLYAIHWKRRGRYRQRHPDRAKQF